VISCSTIVVNGDNVQLAPKTSACSKIGEKRVWYILWGLVPITDNNLDSVLPKDKPVRIETKYNVIDIIIGVVSGSLIGGFVTTHTAEIYVCSK